MLNMYHGHVCHVATGFMAQGDLCSAATCPDHELGCHIHLAEVLTPRPVNLTQGPSPKYVFRILKRKSKIVDPI